MIYGTYEQDPLLVYQQNRPTLIFMKSKETINTVELGASAGITPHVVVPASRSQTSNDCMSLPVKCYYPLPQLECSLLFV